MNNIFRNFLKNKFKQKKWIMVFLILASVSLFSKSIDLLNLPPRPIIQQNIRIDQRQSFSEDKEVFIYKKTILQQSLNLKNHNFMKPKIEKTLQKGILITLLDGIPWIVKNRTRWEAWYYCNTLEGKGFINSNALLFRHYQDKTTTAGIKLIPELFAEKNCVALRFYFDCTTGKTHFMIPIHQISNGYETKIIPENISLRDADQDGKIDFILSGTLYNFTINQNWGTLSKAEAWISFRNEKLVWIYTKEDSMLYPTDRKYEFNYVKNRKKGSKQIISIEKIIKQVGTFNNKEKKGAPKESQKVILYSKTNLTRIPANSNKPLEKPLFFPASGKVTENYLRLRKGPTLKDEVITLLQKNTSLTVINLSDEKQTIGTNKDFWYQVRTAKGQTGWVFGSFLQIKQGNG